MSQHPPIRLRISPLTWRILTRRGWYRAVPFWDSADMDRLNAHRRREWAASTWRPTPWVPGDQVVERGSA